MGWRSSDTAELSYTDVRVPAANLIGGENTGFAQIAGAFVSERVGLAAQAYASAQRCLDLTVEWCRNRETFGRPLISRQSVQNTLAEMARRIDVARVYTRHLVERQLAGERDLITEVCFAKNTAVEAGEWVANPGGAAVRRHGLHGRVRVERQYRDMRILGIGGGTTEILTRWPPRRWDTSRDGVARQPRRPVAGLRRSRRGDDGQARRDRRRARQGAGRWRPSTSKTPRPRQAHPRAHRAAARPRLAVPGAQPAGGVGRRSGGRQRGGRHRRGRGRRCVVNDPTVKGGTSNPWTLRRSCGPTRSRCRTGCR